MSGDMSVLANAIASQGRYGDDVLVHMNRFELADLNRQTGGLMTQNPQTGLPEMFFPFLAGLFGGLSAAAAPAAAAALPAAAAAVPAAATAIPAAATAATALPAAATAVPAAAALPTSATSALLSPSFTALGQGLAAPAAVGEFAAAAAPLTEGVTTLSTVPGLADLVPAGFEATNLGGSIASNMLPPSLIDPAIGSSGLPVNIAQTLPIDPAASGLGLAPPVDVSPSADLFGNQVAKTFTDRAPTAGNQLTPDAVREFGQGIGGGSEVPIRSVQTTTITPETAPVIDPVSDPVIFDPASEPVTSPYDIGVSPVDDPYAIASPSEPYSAAGFRTEPAAQPGGLPLADAAPADGSGGAWGFARKNWLPLSLLGMVAAETLGSGGGEDRPKREKRDAPEGDPSLDVADFPDSSYRPGYDPEHDYFPGYAQGGMINVPFNVGVPQVSANDMGMENTASQNSLPSLMAEPSGLPGAPVIGAQPGGFGMPMFQDGGQVMADTPLSMADPRIALIDAAEAALMGDHPNPDMAIGQFVEAFGEAALVRLQQAIMARIMGDEPRMVRGPGGPTDDMIPARINGVQEARLSDSEVVIPADAVRGAGDGNPDMGAARLMQLSQQLAGKPPLNEMRVDNVT